MLTFYTISQRNINENIKTLIAYLLFIILTYYKGYCKIIFYFMFLLVYPKWTFCVVIIHPQKFFGIEDGESTIRVG